MTSKYWTVPTYYTMYFSKPKLECFFKKKNSVWRKARKMLLIMTASVWWKTCCTFKFFYSQLPSMLQHFTIFILARLFYPIPRASMTLLFRFYTFEFMSFFGLKSLPSLLLFTRHEYLVYAVIQFGLIRHGVPWKQWGISSLSIILWVQNMTYGGCVYIFVEFL